MDSWVLVCRGCQVRIRTKRPDAIRARLCPQCGTPLADAALRRLVRRVAPSPAAAALGLPWPRRLLTLLRPRSTTLILLAAAGGLATALVVHPALHPGPRARPVE